MTVGERIKRRRKELGMTADELADKIGKNRATVYRYESNEIENLPTTVLEPLLEALQTTPAYLMGWEDEEKNKSSSFTVNEREALLDKLDSLDDDIFNEICDFVEYMIKKQAERLDKQD